MRHTMEKMLRNHDTKYIDKVTAKNIQLDFILDVENRLDVLNLSRIDLAKMMNVSKSYVSDILNGNKLVNLKLIAKINRVLGFYTSFLSETKEVYVLRMERERRDCLPIDKFIEVLKISSVEDIIKTQGNYEETGDEWVKFDPVRSF